MNTPTAAHVVHVGALLAAALSRFARLRQQTGFGPATAIASELTYGVLYHTSVG
jgi:hypothetical protein